MFSKKMVEKVLKKFPYLLTESEARAAESDKETDVDFDRVLIRAREALIRLTTAVFLARLRRAGLVEEKTQAVIDASIGNLTLERCVEIQRHILSEKSFPFHEVFCLDFRRRDLVQLLLERYLEDLERLQDLGNRGAGSPAKPGVPVQTALVASNDYIEFMTTYFRSELMLAQPTQPASGPRKVVMTCKEKEGALSLDPLVRRTDTSGLEAFVGTGLGGLEFLPLVGGEPRWCVDREILQEFFEVFLQMGAYRQAVTLGEVEDPGKPSGVMQYATFCCSGLEHMRRAKFHLAILDFDRAFKIRPDIPLLHFHLGRAHEKLNNFKKAKLIFENLSARFPESDLMLETLGDLYKKKGADDEARKIYERAVEKNPCNIRAMEKAGALERWSSKPKDEPKPAEEKKPAEAAQQEAPGANELLVDLTEEAEHGRLVRAVGRDRELSELIEILSCQNRRNPLILGEPGVGKTALVEDLANRIVAGRVPERLQGYKVYLMSIASILAGAKYRGQFEERILGLIKDLKQQRCILFIDDMHTIMGSGVSRGGTLDTSSLLKPALIRGEVQAIGATSHEDYRLNIEKDTSLMRCFQTVSLEEPDWDTVRLILDDHIAHLCEYHNVRFDDFDRVELTRVIKVCIKDRMLPDIAINLFDRAAAKVSLRAPGPGEDEASCRTVRRMDVIEVLSEVSGVPVSKLSRSQTERFLYMEKILSERVIGQEEAVAAVSRVTRTTKLNFDLNPKRPDGVFLFVGPSGVGKTEMARAMAEFLFGDEEKLIRIDMSEYMEKISSSRLIGAAPGYVGYNDQNQLTDQVRKNPYCLVLLDEIEKADDQMINLFLQVFDAGRLTDGKGRTVYFNNSTIVMTSNIGTHLFSKTPVGYTESEGEGAVRVSRPELMREIKRFFAPEFLNRIDEIVFFTPLSLDHIKSIALLKLRDVTDRLRAQGIDFVVAERVLADIVTEGYSAEFGARNLARVIRRRILDPLAERSLHLRWSEVKRAEVLEIQPEFVLKTYYKVEEGEPDSVEISEIPAQLATDAEPGVR